jgi:hypothetical protein
MTQLPGETSRTQQKAKDALRSKTCREESAEAIVATKLPRREGLNQARWK